MTRLNAEKRTKQLKRLKTALSVFQESLYEFNTTLASTNEQLNTMNNVLKSLKKGL